MSTLFTSVPSKRLSVSITASATTAVLSDILGWDGASLTASDFGTVGYGVFRNSTNTVMEFFEWDPSTITVGATTGITLSKRGLKFTGDLTTQVTANKLTWVRGDTIIELGSNPSQIYQYLKDYIDGIAVAGSPDASTTAKGLVEEATQAEVDAGTTAGATAARLFVNPSTIRAGNYNDYVADTGVADAYAIAPSPAITAYAAGQIFTFKAANANTGASTVNVNALGTKSIKKNVSLALAAGDIAASAIVTVVYDGTNFQLLSVNTKKFGGIGTDGALSIASGTTTINLASAKLVVKNYSSISITGTGKLAFSNPNSAGTIVILRSKGDVTLTSSEAPMIDLVGIGAAAATASWATPLHTTIPPGSTGGPSAGGAGGTAPYPSISAITDFFSRLIPLAPGAGGGASEDSIAGGAGGGSLLVECGGAWNFTTSAGISTAGVAGTTGTSSNASGGGGGGGVCIVLYETLTANTGTITVSGGAGGAANGSNDGGGGGASILNNGSAGGTGNGAGGAGGNGFSLVAQNNYFA